MGEGMGIDTDPADIFMRQREFLDPHGFLHPHKLLRPPEPTPTVNGIASVTDAQMQTIRQCLFSTDY
jgi:hypothetical protein